MKSKIDFGDFNIGYYDISELKEIYGDDEISNLELFYDKKYL